MSYQSPIELTIRESANKFQENAIMKTVFNLGINVDKDELIKALNYDRDSYHRGYMDGLNADRWISVEERLPNKDELVLCIGAKGGMFLGDRLSLSWNGKYAYAHVPNSNSGRHALYWMPLPKPPQTEEERE